MGQATFRWCFKVRSSQKLFVLVREVFRKVACSLSCLMLIMGAGLLAAVIGCASTEDRERMTLSKEFDKWLGQYKDHRIIEKGPPDRCVGKGGGTEICEWRVDGNALRYLYDANSIARRWKYSDRRLGEMKGAQDPAAAAEQTDEYHETLWEDVKDTIDDIHFAPASGQ